MDDVGVSQKGKSERNLAFHALRRNFAGSMNKNSSIIYNKKATFVTLGCKLNYAETSTLRDRLAERGCQSAAEGEQADICIINTCSVTGEADAKCRHAIHRLHREHPGAFIAVMGCYAQLSGEHIAKMDGVNLVVGQESKGRIIELIEEHYEAHALGVRAESEAHGGVFYTTPLKDIRSFVPSCSRGDRTRYFLKVQDGCNYFCTYCTIPAARGLSRNASIADIVAQAEEAAAAGGREIVITGVNIGDFGRSTGETFFQLVQALDKVEGIDRYRISSIEPNLLTDEIIEFCAKSRAFMPHFHIPLQSGSDDVLRLMRRHYDTALFRSKVEKIKQIIPDAFIGVDVIVGTRGERDEFFEDAYRFIESLDISQLHVFSYSERPGTKALEIPYVVQSQTKRERSQRLLALSEEKRKAHYRAFIGEERPVLWEHARDGKPLLGWTDNYIRVEAALGTEIEPDSLGRVRLGQFNESEEALIATPL